eukprot:CAMPEP_0172625712 /NCGR_PEP_ID=MMETSP1068-20121228/145459_1 /TAXON_ID=35684 /ORGANISM="Pseudopedinella elastica, Strain CCMP716" /LENGTH=422 /DNA_ID=CAMNT_0013435091 /DNA_START=84 /DNA_END=1352 /DNA_ORIENTATION=+
MQPFICRTALVVLATFVRASALVGQRTPPRRKKGSNRKVVALLAGEGQVSSGYPGSLAHNSKYSDDGFTLSAPDRYSVSDWWRHIGSFPQSTILARVSSHLSFNVIFATVLAYASFYIPDEMPVDVPAVYHGLNLNVAFEMSGGILGILLAFRTGQSYDRFWQGREIWAKVINKVRSFSRCVLYVDSAKGLEAAAVVRWLEAFPVCLTQHLRGERDVGALNMLTPEERKLVDSSDSMPIAVTIALTELLNGLKAETNDQSAKHLLWWQFEAMLFELMDTIGEAEAIAGTPVPTAYSKHTSRLLSLWTICMPFVLISCLPPPLVPVVTALVSWMLLATEEIGHLIEEPFGLHNDRPNILPLQRYCDVIAADLANIVTTAPDFAAYAAGLRATQEDAKQTPIELNRGLVEGLPGATASPFAKTT